jgi:hypothetical protein
MFFDVGLLSHFADRLGVQPAMTKLWARVAAISVPSEGYRQINEQFAKMGSLKKCDEVTKFRADMFIRHFFPVAGTPKYLGERRTKGGVVWEDLP